jgi:RNA polymerase sigma factor (sigma-70 family)|tara:strand:- start:784 stop:1317 length:534 start_codon:yes stop_codon:yes gene_type:complete
MRPNTKLHFHEDQDYNFKNIISIYKRQNNKLIFYSNSICGNIQMAQDIVQNTFLILLQKNNLHKIENIKNYIFRCIKLNTYNHLKKIKNQNRILNIVNISKSIFHTTNDKDYDFLKEKIILDSINSLPKKRRKIFIMKRIEKKSLKEISIELGVSCKTVENHMTFALRDLKKKVIRF